MMTIKETALGVMQNNGSPMTAEEVYEAIIANDLYEFHSDNALHIVTTQIRRYCQGLDFAGSSANKCFEQTVDGKYFPLAWPATQPKTVQQEVHFGKKSQQILQTKIRTQTSTQRLVDARHGQGDFRRELELVWGGKCAVTGCAIGAVLRASHIKPWAESTNSERLDSNNGLLLTSNLDALFDRFLITFSENGKMLISASIPENQLKILGIGGSLRKVLNTEQIKYLTQHRKFFEQKEAL